MLNIFIILSFNFVYTLYSLRYCALCVHLSLQWVCNCVSYIFYHIVYLLEHFYVILTCQTALQLNPISEHLIYKNFYGRKYTLYVISLQQHKNVLSKSPTTVICRGAADFLGCPGAALNLYYSDWGGFAVLNLHWDWDLRFVSSERQSIRMIGSLSARSGL